MPANRPLLREYVSSSAFIFQSVAAWVLRPRGPAEAAASDDHAVASRLAQHAQRIPTFPDVAVAQHRDADGRLERADGVPVGVAGVELRRRARVQADGGGSFGLGLATVAGLSLVLSP